MPLEITLHNVQWAVADIELRDREGNPVAGKQLALNDQDSNMTFVIPFSLDKAEEVAASLTGKAIQAMRGMTPAELRAAAQQQN
jgi:hypothetical protein